MNQVGVGVSGHGEQGRRPTVGNLANGRMTGHRPCPPWFILVGFIPCPGKGVKMGVETVAENEHLSAAKSAFKKSDTGNALLMFRKL